MTTQQTKFRNALADAYRYLFVNDPEYAYSASKLTPEALADKMTAAMIANSANHEGAGFRRACKTVGIKHTRTAIRAYLAAEAEDDVCTSCGTIGPWSGAPEAVCPTCAATRAR